MTEIGPKNVRSAPWELAVGPGPEQWDDWVELDSRSWPKRVEKHYRCVPTLCFNCESGCGLLAFVDKETGEIRKFEGNPVHPGSRGRTCAKGPATINQIQDPERILRPMKRSGPRGSGSFVEASWEEALDDIGGRIAKALREDRHDEVMYHVGRPGDDHFVMRMLQAWGIDGHNSHTNVCSGAARLGYTLTCGADRPSPDYKGTRFALLLSAHLETGHYFNPHAQRIVDAMDAGARVAVLDSRLSNTASRADLWISPWPGTEAALLLSVARELLERDAVDHDYLREWSNWEQTLEQAAPERERSFEQFLAFLSEQYAEFTPEFAARECRISVESTGRIADEIVRAEGRFTSHLWRNAAAGHLGGWQIARALMLLHVLTGSVGTEGGVNPNSWDKFVPKPKENPPHITRWSELLWPREYPLAHYEMSFLLPHLMRQQDKQIDVYFTRVYNPVWTNPDGCSWIEMLEDEQRVGCHVALTPTWNETAQWADWVLPMGHGPERHDLVSQETHAGTWIGFRQPVLREHRKAEGEDARDSRDSNPGEVWEEAEFWVALTWRIDPDGSLGIRRWYESKERPGQPVSMDEYWGDIFENSVPGLPEAAAEQGTDPLGFMRKFGAFAVPYAGQRRFEQREGEGKSAAGWPTPSKKLEVYSPTMTEWGWPEHALPGYVRSQVHWQHLDESAGEMALLPTFRLPTLIHTRSANSKWLQEISHTNPLWIHHDDADRLGIENQGFVRVTTEIGHFVLRAWRTEGIHPGVVACSHHVGRWRLHAQGGGGRLGSSIVDLQRSGPVFLFRQKRPVEPFASPDPDTERIWWEEVGVNQNLTFPVQADPVSGMHCWHQKVTVERARAEDRYGDVRVDTSRSRAAFERWLELCRPAPGPGGLRRPLWLKRPNTPVPEAYRLD